MLHDDIDVNTYRFRLCNKIILFLFLPGPEYRSQDNLVSVSNVSHKNRGFVTMCKIKMHWLLQYRAHLRTAKKP